MGFDALIYSAIMFLLFIIALGVMYQAFMSWLRKFKWSLTLPYRILKKIFKLFKNLIKKTR